MSDQQLLPSALAGMQKKALLVAVVAGGLFAAYAVVAPGSYEKLNFFQSYLIGFLFALAAALGSLVLLCIHHLAPGGWGYCIRRILEAGCKTIPWMALLFLPVLLFGMPTLYDWYHLTADASAEVIAKHDPHHLVSTKTAAYLNMPGFIFRYLLCFAIWGLMGYKLHSWSKKQDETGDLAYRRKMKFLAGPAILIYVLLATFAMVDWIMSIEGEWFSSIYGVIFCIGHGQTIFAFSIIFVSWLSNFQPLKEEWTKKRQHDIGKLLFAFIILWAYVNVSQFIIIWCGNLPEEITWYMNRAGDAFASLSLFLVLFLFAVPFFILLNQNLKKQKHLLTKVAWWILFMRIVDLSWNIIPSIHQPETDYSGLQMWHATDLLAPVAFGALWFVIFLHYFRKLPVLPVRDPQFSKDYNYLEEAA